MRETRVVESMWLWANIRPNKDVALQVERLVRETIQKVADEILSNMRDGIEVRDFQKGGDNFDVAEVYKVVNQTNTQWRMRRDAIIKKWSK